MNQKYMQAVTPVTVATLVVMFLATLFFVNPSLSSAATETSKTTPVARTSAVDYAEAQIKQLQDALKITAAQEPLWNDVTVAMRENAKEVDAIRKERAELRTTMNAVERMKFHSKITESQLNQLRKFIPTFEVFYNSLSDAQKKSTDDIFSTGKYRKTKKK